jgi:hypothetical protein
MRIWITIWPSHSYTLAYFKPIHLISIGFQSIDSHLGAIPKKTLSYPSIVPILQSMRSLWLRFFLNTTRIIRYKILWLKLEKIISFWYLSYMPISTISNFKVLIKQSFSICFPPASCFMRFSFHFFCKICTTNMSISFAWYLHVIYLYYKYIDIPHNTC